MRRGLRAALSTVTAAAFLITASPAMAMVDTYAMSTAKKKTTKKPVKKKATPIYYATLNDGSRAQCTIVGKTGSDKIQGTPGDDVICGLGGNDKIYGNGGNDFIDGGAGNDLIIGGEGDDLISGSGGADKLDGGNGDDVQYGGEGNDTVSGSNGIDELIGDNGNDKVIGGTGDDELLGGPGKDTLSGESGNDELDGGQGKDVVAGGAGDNTCVHDTADRGPTGCYFDNSNPSISGVTIDPAVIDTSTGPQTFNVYLQLHDDTGGFGIYSIWSQSNVGLNFSRIKLDPSGNALMTNANLVNGMVTVASCSKVARAAVNQPWMQKPIGCRVGGDRMNPLIRVTYTLPQYSAPGKYQLTSLFISDAANNRVNYQYRQCQSCTGWADSSVQWIQDVPVLANASLQQAGPGDVSPPTVTSISYETYVNTASQDRILELTLNAADDYGFGSSNPWGSVANVNFLNTTYAVPNSGPIPTNANVQGMAAGIMCSEQSSFNIGGSMPMGCQESPGVFKLKMRLSQSLPEGFYQLMNINIVDAAGNSRNYGSCIGCQNLGMTNPDGSRNYWVSEVPNSGNIEKRGFVSVNSGAAPRLVNFTVETPQVNSAGSDVFAGMVLTLHDDDGLGLTGSYINLGFSRSATDMNGQVYGGLNMMTTAQNSSMHLPTCAEVNQPGNNWQMGCLRSSGGGDYVVYIPVRVPAHAGSGTYYLTNLSISDGINVAQYMSSAATMRPPNSFPFEDVLGFRPTFVNSY